MHPAAEGSATGVHWCAAVQRVRKPLVSHLRGIMLMPGASVIHNQAAWWVPQLKQLGLPLIHQYWCKPTLVFRHFPWLRSLWRLSSLRNPLWFVWASTQRFYWKTHEDLSILLLAFLNLQEHRSCELFAVRLKGRKWLLENDRKMILSSCFPGILGWNWSSGSCSLILF